MSIDTGRGKIDEGSRRRGMLEELTPVAKPVQAGPGSVQNPSREPVDQGRQIRSSILGAPTAKIEEAMQDRPAFPAWLGRLGFYGLALLLVGVAALLRWTLWDVLSPTPFLVFYLAWVAAAAFGGLGPGLLATLVSWWCIDFLFDPTPSHIGFHDTASIARLLIFLAGGLAVSVVGEKMRRSRIYKRRQGRELAAANAALRASEFHLARAQQMAHLGSWSWDIAADRLYWSDEIYRLYGLQPGESVPRHEDFLGFVHPEDRPRVEQGLREALARGGPCQLDFRIVQRGGQERYVHCEAQTILDSEGHPTKAEGALQDITERKRAEQDLSESRNQYQALIETTADFIWEMDASGKYTYCSPQMKGLWGYEPKDMIGKTPFEVMPPEDREQAIASFMSLAKSPKPFTGLEASSYDSQGRLITVEISGVPFFDADGRLLGYRGISRDVTERKRAQEALAESRKKYRGLVEKVNDWVWEIDADGVYTYSSPRALDLLGYAPEEIVGRTPFDLMPSAEAQRVWNAFQPIWLERKPLERLENTLVRKDGRLVTVETSGMPVFAEDGAFLGYTGVDRDVTERKWAEEQLRRSEQDLNRAQAVAQTGSWRLDVRRNELLWSRETHRMFGIPEGTPMTYETFLAAVPPADQEYVDRQWTAALRGEPYDIEHRIVVDGQLKWVRERAELEFDEEGTLLGGFGTVQDITERKQAEEALQRSEEKFAKAFRSSPIAIAVTRLSDGRILDANEAMLKLLHFTPNEVIGRTTRDLDIWVDVNDRAQFTQMLSTVGSVRDLEYRLRTKDGAIVTIHLSAEVLEFGGEPCLLSTLVDVTERQRAAEALRQEKTFTDKLLNAPLDTVFLFEPVTGQPVRWNKRFAEVSGYDDQEIAGMKAPDDFYDENDLKKAQECMGRILADGQGVVALSLITKQGVHIPFEYVATVVEAEDGKTLLLSIGRDITERERAEEALRESEERFRIMADGSPNPIWVTNAEGERIFANKQYLEYFGISEQEMEGGEWKPFIHPDDAPTYVNSFMSSLNEHRSFSAEARVRRADGQWRWIESHAEPRLSIEGEFLGFVGITQDVTQRKQAEQELRELNATLESRVARRTAELQYRAGQLQKLTLELTEAEERERKRVAEILHDDLQQVLAAAKFHVGLLSSRVKNDAESQEIAEQAKDLLGDAIAKSRSLSHELSAPVLSQSNLGEAFEWLAEQMQTKHGFTVHLDMGERIELASEPLRVLLYKAAQELLFNAIKHAGVHEAKLRLRQQHGRIQLLVSDAGRGFDPTEPGCNLGFGLLSIRERVEYLGGRMKIRSAVGKGSTFLITVPDAGGSP